MTLAIAVGARAVMLDGFNSYTGTGSGTAKLTVYQTNTSLCVFNLATTSFGSGNNDSIVLASTPISNTGTAVAGNANRFIIINRDAATVLTGTISAVGGGGDIEVPTVAVTASSTQKLNALVLRLSATGLLTLEASLTLV